jgi:alpha-amylase
MILGVMMQAFCSNCPDIEGKPFGWWSYLRDEIPKIAPAGFTAFWPPPASKAASNISLGYDPYDYYGTGEFNQKGSMAIWFGLRTDLIDLITTATMRICKSMLNYRYRSL